MIKKILNILAVSVPMIFLGNAGISLVYGNVLIKEPNVSGQFYNSNADVLSTEIKKYFEAASVETPPNDAEIVIVPHAGYVFSGGVAAHAYKAVSQKSYRTIVILAPTHFFPFNGISVWPQGSFRTPLGLVQVDEEATQKLMSLCSKCMVQTRVFEREHSLEVQLPFLQQTFQDFKIVPVIMGQVDYAATQEFATALNQLIGERSDVLVVVSSDMSHYYEDTVARTMDQKTIKAVEGLAAEELWNGCKREEMQLCGFIPVTTALTLAKMRNLQPQLLHYANSGDVTGDKSNVVGYMAVVMSRQSQTESVPANKTPEGPDMISPLDIEQKRKLITIARSTLEVFLRTGQAPDFQETDPRLLKNEEGVFVTIRKKGELRGCIGNIIGEKALYQTVRDMAISAAAQDHRFNPVTQDELGEIEVEVSVLSKPRKITDVLEIEVGVHGIILSQGWDRRGVFLPQVATEWGWNREQLLTNLCTHKAGLPADCWRNPKTTMEIFTADVFSEEDVDSEKK